MTDRLTLVDALVPISIQVALIRFSRLISKGAGREDHMEREHELRGDTLGGSRGTGRGTKYILYLCKVLFLIHF